MSFILDPEFFKSGMDFFSNLFTKWQWKRDPFFQRVHNGAMVGTDTPQIDIDCDDSIAAYEDCPHLRAVIDKKAEMFANGEWKCVAIEDETQEFPDDPGLKLLKKPNPLQSMEDFLFQASFFKSLFSNNFIYKLQGSSFVAPKVMWHLPSDQIKLKLKNMQTFYDQTELNSIIDKFVLCQAGFIKEYDVNDVIYKAENFSFREGKGLSKIPSLKLPVNNLMASLKTRNVMTVNFGVKGFISSEGKDVVGPVGIKATEKELIEKEFEKDSNLYSTKPKVKIVNVPTKFNSMSAPIKDMLLLESEEADFKTICALFGMRKDIFPFTAGSTFENQIQAEKGTYHSTIFQDADSFAGVMTEALKPGPGKKYILCYDWLPIMKEDAKSEAETSKIETDRMSILYDKGIISPEAWAEMEDVKYTGDGITKSQPKQINVP